MAQDQPTWKTVEPNIWKAEKDGDSIEGVLTNVEKDIGENNSMMYTLETSDGFKSIWGTTVLDMRMKLCKVGNKVRITFKGKEESKKGREVKIFKVEVAV